MQRDETVTLRAPALSERERSPAMLTSFAVFLSLVLLRVIN